MKKIIAFILSDFFAETLFAILMLGMLAVAIYIGIIDTIIKNI